MKRVEDDAPAPAKDRGTLKQCVRAACGNVPAKQAAVWLHEFTPLVEVLVRKLLPRAQYISGFGREDFVAVGRIAVLEACATHNPEGGGALRTWVWNIVWWRLADMLEGTRYSGVETPNHLQARLRFELVEDDDFELRFEFREDLGRVAEAFHELPLRSQHVVLLRLEGQTSPAIATGLGISPRREEQLVARARALFRQVLDGAELPECGNIAEIQ